MKNNLIEVEDIQISVTSFNDKDYICISDIAKAKSDKSRAADVIRNWLRNRSTLDFLTAWEQLYNPNFKVFESEHFETGGERNDTNPIRTIPPLVRWWLSLHIIRPTFR